MPYAMYLRKSRAEEGQSTQEVLAKHQAALLSLAEKLNIDVTDTYEEVVSGESLYARPEMLRLLEQVQAGAYDAVLCMDIDRLGRGGMADQGVILDAFRLSDTKIITPEKSYDLNDETDEQLTEFKAFFARQEYKMIRKRMRRGLLQAVQAGAYVANPPYGYKKCMVGKLPSLEIVEEEAKFIRHIFSRYLAGTGAQIIAAELNAMGSVPRRNAEWNRNTVRHILRNPTFMGKVAWNRVKHYRPGTHGKDKHHVVYTSQDEWILVDGLHPAIISPEDWYKAQDVRTSRQLPPVPHGNVANPFAGLIVCSQCGKKMQRLGANNGVPYIMCTRPGCCAAAKEEFVEELLIDLMQRRLDAIRADLARSAPPDLAPTENALEAVSREIEKIDARIPRLYEFLEDGTYDRATFRQRLDAAESEKAALLEKQAGLEKELEHLKGRDLRKLAAQLDYVLRLYPTMDAAGKNNLLKTVLDKVFYTKYKKTKPQDFTLSLVLKDF